jgi:hypothetical protein
MVITGNIFIGLAALEFLAVLILLNGTDMDKGMLALVVLLGIVIFFTCSALYCVLVAAGRLDALGIPRGLLYPGAVVSCACLVIFTASALASNEFKPADVSVALRFFGPQASWVVPILMLVLAFLMLHNDLVPRIPLSLLRSLLFALGLVGIGVSISMFVEGVMSGERNRKERTEANRTAEIASNRETLAKVQQADPVSGFATLLECTEKHQPLEIRQLATQKLLSNGPKFAPLLAAQLRTGDHERALQFLLDNDPPAAASLAGPARDAMLRVSAHVRDVDTIIWATDFERLTDLLLKVADKYSVYGFDYIPAIKDYRAALDTPGNPQLYQPREYRQKVDAWLAGKRKP